MNPSNEKLHKKCIDNPLAEMISKDIRSMSDQALPDIYYFLNDSELDDDLGEEGFYIF